jgi:hypothetical protein
MDRRLPFGGGNEISGVVGAGNRKEMSSPRVQVVEVHTWGSGHYAIEVVGELFGVSDALPSA